MSSISDITDFLWQQQDFERFREQFFTAILRKVQIEKHGDINSLKNQVIRDLRKLYGDEIFATNKIRYDSSFIEREEEKILHFLSKYSKEELNYAHLGIQYNLPKEVLMHLTRDEMMALFIGLGKATRLRQKNFIISYFNMQHSLISIISRIMSENLANSNLLNRDYFTIREPGLVYDISLNRPIYNVDLGNLKRNLEGFIRYINKAKRTEKEKIKKKPQESNKHRLYKEYLQKRHRKIYFEVQLTNRICADAIAIENGKIIVYEIKSSTNHYFEGIEQLKEIGAFIYYVFGIEPKLKLRYFNGITLTEEEIPMPKVNPIYRGKNN